MTEPQLDLTGELLESCAQQMPPVAVNRRLHELREAQLVLRLDLTRKTPSGHPAHVYVRSR